MDKKNQMKYNQDNHALIAQHQSGPLPREDTGEAPAERTNTVRQHGLFYAKIVIYEGVLNDDWIEKAQMANIKSSSSNTPPHGRTPSMKSLAKTSTRCSRNTKPKHQG